MNKLFLELEKYKNKKQQDFLSKLVPTIDKKYILGVKNPDARAVAKKMYKEDEKACLSYIKILPHKYLEEYILHTSILEQIKDYDFVVKETDKLLPYIDNWATCDTYSPKIVKKHLDDFYKYLLKWVKSNKTYTIRFAIQNFMSFYFDEKCKMDGDQEKYIEEFTDIVTKIRFKSKYKYKKESQIECPDKYYVDMMIAWFFQVLLVKRYDIAIKYLKAKKLEPWTNNMAIRKAKESYRISDKLKKDLDKYIIRGK